MLLNPIDIVEDVIHQKNGILVEQPTMSWSQKFLHSGVHIDCILPGRKI